FYEPESGYLLARASTQAVVDHFIAEGGEYCRAAVAAQHLENDLESRSQTSLRLSDGTIFVADLCIFACGPWLGRLFPRTVGPHFISTRQEVFFFGTPRDDPRYNEPTMPVWSDHTDLF